MKLIEVDIDLSKNQLNNLMKGKPVRVKHSQIGKLGVTLKIRESLASKLITAKRKGKGKEIQMSEEEIEGNGFKSAFKKLGHQISKVAHKTVDLYHDHVKDTAVGKAIKKAAKSTVEKAIKKAPELLGKATEAIPGVGKIAAPFVEDYGHKLADKYADKLSEKAVDKIGLGIHDYKKYGKRAHMYLGKGMEFERQTPVLQSAALSPPLPFKDFSMLRAGKGILPPGYHGHGIFPAGYR